MSIHHGPPCVICGRPTFGRTRAEAASRVACRRQCADKARLRTIEERDLYADRWAARSRELIAQGVDRDRAHVLAARELMGASHG